MRRTYTRERFLDRVALIREHVPDCAITTDIIVGFPGETEADFEETLEVAEEVGFDGAFTFIYSPRRGTEAAAFADDFLPHEVCVGAHGAPRRGRPAPRPRARPALRRPHARRARRGHLAHRRRRVRGRTRHNKVVNFDGLAQPGEIVPVDDHVATSQTLTGEESLLARAARVAPLQSVRLVCEHTFVCGGIRSRSSRISKGASRATRRRSSAASTHRRHSTPASTRSTPSPR